MLIKSRKIAIMNLFMDKMLKKFVNFQVTLKVMRNYNEMVANNKQKKFSIFKQFNVYFPSSCRIKNEHREKK